MFLISQKERGTTMETTIYYSVIMIYGIIIGSFLNVLIYRIPKHENFTSTRSHCMSCGYQLKWYDLIPLFSYLTLGGKCRKCRTKISIQYPLIELMNGVLYLLIFWKVGFNYVSVLYALMASALLALSVIDDRTYEIPPGFNYFIGALGIVRLVLDFHNWSNYIIGFFAISGLLYFIILVTKGRGMGGGDCKLMAAAGLLLGWKLIILAFFLGCILGSVIHLLRMKITKADHVLAFGPYLAMAILVSVLYGNELITWYITTVL